MIRHIKVPGSKFWRVLLLAFLFSPLAAVAREVRIAVGMDYTNAVRLLVQNGGKDISAGQEVFGLKGEWPLNGLYWSIQDYNAIIALSATNGKIAQMTFWSKADFEENKVQRAKTEQIICAITLDTKSRRRRIAMIDPPAIRQPSRTATTGGQSQPDKAPPVKTTFVADAELSAQEVSEVVSLARQCGISEPGEVVTFNWLPGGGKGISVKSVERLKGADIAYDEITIAKAEWGNIGVSGKGKQVGTFWADPSDKYTPHIRLHDFRGEQIRVSIGKGITVELADQVIPQLGAGKVFFPPECQSMETRRGRMAEFAGLKPSALSTWADGKLLLHFVGCDNCVQFHLDKGEVIIDGLVYVNY